MWNHKNALNWHQRKNQRNSYFIGRSVTVSLSQRCFCLDSRASTLIVHHFMAVSWLLEDSLGPVAKVTHIFIFNTVVCPSMVSFTHIGTRSLQNSEKFTSGSTPTSDYFTCHHLKLLKPTDYLRSLQITSCVDAPLSEQL